MFRSFFCDYVAAVLHLRLLKLSERTVINLDFIYTLNESIKTTTVDLSD